MAEVHKAGLLHRDIKPGNIYLKQDGESMLIDFGAARQSVGEKSKSMSAIVSDGYAPPEQYNSHSKQGAWTDLYAIGAVMYHLMMGEKPVASSHRQHQLMDEETDPLVPLDKTTYSEGLIAATESCLIVKAKQRPQSVKQLQEILARKEEGLQEKKPTKPEESINTAEQTRKIDKPIKPQQSNDQIDDKLNEHSSSNPPSNQNLSKPSLTKIAVGVILAIAAGDVGYYQSQLGDKAWELAQDAGTPARLVEFINEYSDSEFVSKAQNRLNYLDKKTWDKAKEANTEQSYQVYLDTFTKGNYYQQAQDAIIEIKAARLQAEREQAIAQELANRTYPLKINTLPEDSKVELLNSSQSYRPNMALKAGDYRVKVSKSRFESKTKTVSLSQYNTRFDISLSPLLYPLTIITSPKGAKIELLNTDKTYEVGVKLKAGEHQVRVSKEGFGSQTQTVSLSQHNTSFDINLVSGELQDEIYTVNDVSFQ